MTFVRLSSTKKSPEQFLFFCSVQSFAGERGQKVAQSKTALENQSGSNCLWQVFMPWAAEEQWGSCTSTHTHTHARFFLIQWSPILHYRGTDSTLRETASYLTHTDTHRRRKPCRLADDIQHTASVISTQASSVNAASCSHTHADAQTLGWWWDNTD